VRRHAFGFASALSLLLLLASLGLWGSGYRFGFWTFADDQRGGLAVIYSAHGSLSLGMTRWPRNGAWSARVQRVDNPDSFTPAIGYSSTSTPVVRSFLGVQVIQVRGWLATPTNPALFGSGPVLPLVSINVPLIWPTLLTAVPPLAWLVLHLRRRRRLGTNLCIKCGYNLTGNVSGVCPECGTAVAGEAGA
jgi:hypothetical protein